MSLNYRSRAMGGSSSGPSLGLGLELLMNDKKKTASNSMNVDLGELDKLEDELNNLSSSSSNPDTKSINGMGGFGNFFGFNNTPKEKEPEKSNTSEYNLGQATSDGIGNTKTWDGFSKMSDVPLENHSSSSKLSDREKRRKKRLMIKKIEVRK